MNTCTILFFAAFSFCFASGEPTVLIKRNSEKLIIFFYPLRCFDREEVLGLTSFFSRPEVFFKS